MMFRPINICPSGTKESALEKRDPAVRTGNALSAEGERFATKVKEMSEIVKSVTKKECDDTAIPPPPE
jgi:hypothetical protein